jgi:hypothetical protein
MLFIALALKNGAAVDEDAGTGAGGDGEARIGAGVGAGVGTVEGVGSDACTGLGSVLIFSALNCGGSM